MIRYGVDWHALEDEQGLPRGLLAAVSHVESRDNPEAVSPAGAVGLMQIMPATAKELGVDPYSPAESVQGAARYLGRLMRQFGGDLNKAIAAYNGGPGRLERLGGDIDRMPRESREYVPKVLNRLNESIEPWALYGSDQQVTPQEPPVEPWALYSQPASAAPAAVRDPDVPAGVGEAGYSQRDPDVPYAPTTLRPGDPDVPVPGTPDEYRAPWKSSQEAPVAPGSALIHPRDRAMVESLARGLTDPVGADFQNLGAFLPQRAAFGGRTLSEIEFQGEQRYQSQRDKSSIDLARGGASLVPLMLMQGSMLPRSSRFSQILQNMAGGYVGATAVPANPEPLQPYDPDKPSYGLSPDQVELLNTRSLQGLAGATGGAAGGLAATVLPRVARIIPGIGKVADRTARSLLSRTAAARGAIAGNLTAGHPEPSTPEPAEAAPWELYQQPSPAETAPWEIYQ